MSAFEDVEAAWRICDQTREYSAKEGREIPIQEMLDKIILQSPLVDIERTKRESKTDLLTKVYLKSAYGIEYRDSTKNWIPFRHGPVKF